MAFLRFVRDKRGYESTFLLQNSRADGRTRSRVLYWFRSPPNVKVGRAVFDEEAIRLIEEANPDIEIDWAKVLKAKPPPPPPDRQGRRRGAEGRRSEPAAAPRRTRSGRKATGEPSAPVDRTAGQPGDAPAVPSAPAEPPGDAREPPVEEPPASSIEESAESPSADVRVHPVEQRIGAQGLARLQARYAELLARITERVTDPARREALRAEAEALDPDSWVTAEEAVAGIEQFDARFAELKTKLGRRRRRSRRGGRRRRGGARGTNGGTADAGGEAHETSAPTPETTEAGSGEREPDT